MKRTNYTYLLSALLCTTITHNALSMNVLKTMAKCGIAGACSLTELFITSAPVLNTVIFQPNDLRAEKLKDAQSDAPQIVTDYITHIATERGLKNAKVILNGDAHDYCTNTNGNIVYIPTKQAEELESLLTNNNRNGQEEKKLNEHIGTIHHELTHNINSSLKYVPMYDAAIGTTGAVTTSAILSHYIKKQIPIIQKNFALRNCFKLVRSGTTAFVAFNLMHMNMYGKYDELKADDGVPNKKELLDVLAETFEDRHASHLRCVDIIKEKADYPTILWKELPDDMFSRKQLLAMKILPKKAFDNAIVMDTIFYANAEHPSDLRRAERFRKRSAELL